MKRFYDRKRGEDPGYKPGDEVYLLGKNLTTHRPMKSWTTNDTALSRWYARLELPHTSSSYQTPGKYTQFSTQFS
jgi:hypothetical protein